MLIKKNNLSHTPTNRSFRLEHALVSSVETWLEKNPGINFSTLTNLAIRNFITHPQTMEPVDTIEANDKEIHASIHKNLKKHRDAIDRLK
jgi:hypothetical protein